ncbi:histidine phosphatase family protein [Actinomadura decatromicini]|uniref:Histidine phosphatase family protein n=1 Tax=Actinomadura decatromicini TaxID=2604572 RepID=A0A5D3FZD9_9ACTN|nr:histidine phosphatase family protein [Actinomadura decatromicini]TYK53296.1 histidine phosphatase family protein [Actinomadura decatromicini]
MSDRLRIWCLRHAESANVITGTAGVVPAAPLTERGRHQALAAARLLADEPITQIYSSTGVRARQTAEHLTSLPALTVTAMPELNEVGIGRHEGTTDPAIRARTAEVLHAWIVQQNLDQRVSDGETGHDVLARMTATLRKIAAAHPGETVVVVGHVASLTITLARLCALGSQVWGTPLPHARPFLVEWDGQAWHCPAWPEADAPAEHRHAP